jgi:hypothetical protein
MQTTTFLPTPINGDGVLYVREIKSYNKLMEDFSCFIPAVVAITMPSINISEIMSSQSENKSKRYLRDHMITIMIYQQ